MLRCLNILDHPDAGIIRVGDLEIDSARATKAQILALRRRTAFTFQNYALFANRTAHQTITESLLVVKKLSHADADVRANTILRETGLADKADAYPASLQQQRVGIGRAMALNTELMLFDEPTSSLDPEWVGEVRDLTRWVAERRQTMQIVTREMQFAREIADHVVFMDGGRFVKQGPPHHIFQSPHGGAQCHIGKLPTP